MKRFQKFTGEQQERLFQEERVLNVQWVRGQQRRGVQGGGTGHPTSLTGDQKCSAEGLFESLSGVQSYRESTATSFPKFTPTASLSEGSGPTAFSHGDKEKKRQTHLRSGHKRGDGLCGLISVHSGEQSQRQIWRPVLLLLGTSHICAPSPNLNGSRQQSPTLPLRTTFKIAPSPEQLSQPHNTGPGCSPLPRQLGSHFTS